MIKKSDKAIKLGELNPKFFEVLNYGANGVRVYLETQTNRAMKRDFMARIIISEGSKSLSAVIDRDELISYLKIE